MDSDESDDDDHIDDREKNEELIRNMQHILMQESQRKQTLVDIELQLNDEGVVEEDDNEIEFENPRSLESSEGNEIKNPYLQSPEAAEPQATHTFVDYQNFSYFQKPEIP